MTYEIEKIFEKYKMVSSVNTVSLKKMLEEAFALGHEKALEEVEKYISKLRKELDSNRVPYHLIKQRLEKLRGGEK